MKLKEIMAISGHAGLFKYIAQGRNGVIVEGLEDKKRINAYTSYKVSSLEDIAVFTASGEVPLKDVFKKIHEKENGGEAIGTKATNEELKKYLESILPDYDREKVYVSDIKKMVSWYNILHHNNLLDFTEEESTEKKDGNEEAAASENTETSENK